MQFGSRLRRCDQCGTLTEEDRCLRDSRETRLLNEDERLDLARRAAGGVDRVRTIMAAVERHMDDAADPPERLRRIELEIIDTLASLNLVDAKTAVDELKREDLLWLYGLRLEEGADAT